MAADPQEEEAPPQGLLSQPPPATLFQDADDELPLDELLAMFELAEAAAAAATGTTTTAAGGGGAVLAAATTAPFPHPAASPLPAAALASVPPPVPPPAPSIPSIEALFVDVLGLPVEVAQAYRRRGVAQPYAWQYECLRTPGVVSHGRNLIYSAPTSGGKSFVADVLLLRRAILTGKQVLLVLPFVAVVREKVQHLQKLLTAYNMRRPKRHKLRVRAFHGNKGGKGFGHCQIGVTTLEKANGLVNKLMAEGAIDSLACCVLDEMHLCGDKQRGYLLELMVSKLLFTMQQRQKRVQAQQQQQGQGQGHGNGNTNPTDGAPAEGLLDLQLIAMSATLPNLEEVAAWMDAALFLTAFRPVQLQELYKLGDGLHTVDGQVVRQLPASWRTHAQDPDRIVTLVEETTSKGHQVLVFCHYRKQAESCAALLAKELGVLPEAVMTGGGGAQKDKHQDVTTRRQALLTSLLEESTMLSPVLKATIPQGVAFHHAGLTDHEKDALEEAFRQGVLSVIAATSTLGTGINLPAARVIFRTLRPGAGREFDTASYRQMAGRAGRAGQQAYGESILLLQAPKDVQEARRLMTEPLPQLRSCLDPETDGGRALVRALLEAIASGALQHTAELDSFLHCMLALRQRSHNATRLHAFLSQARCALQYLVENRIVEEQPEQQQEAPPPHAAADNSTTAAPISTRLVATKLGHALFRSSFAPDEGLLVFQDLKKARERLVLDGNLHLLYLVTPVFHGLTPDFTRLWDIFDRARRVDPVRTLVFELVGLTEGQLDRWSHQPPPYGAGQEMGPLLHMSAATTEDGGAEAAGGASTTTTTSKTVLAGEQLAVMRARRLWGALALQDLVVSERSMESTAMAYQADRGGLQALQQAASSYAGMITAFLTQLEWTLLARALEDAGTMVAGTGSRELVPLMQIPRLELSLSRALFDADIQTVAAVVSEPDERLASIIRTVRPFSSAGEKGNVDRGGELAFFDEAASRLRDAARAVLSREEKGRKSRFEQLQAQWAEGSPSNAKRRGDDDSDSSSDEDDAPAAAGNGDGYGRGEDTYVSAPFWSVRQGCMAARAALTAKKSPLPFQNCDVPSKSFFETPQAIRNPALRPEDYPVGRCARTPTRTPTSPTEFLYRPEVPPLCSQDPPRLPAREACDAVMAAGNPGEGGTVSDLWRGAEFVPEEVVVPCAFVSAAETRAFAELLVGWGKAPCYSLVLHFRDLPYQGDDGRGGMPTAAADVAAPGSSYRRYATQTVPSPLVVADKQQQTLFEPRDDNVILCGVAVSLDGRHATYCWLPPPFPPRPFEDGVILGDGVCAADAKVGEASGKRSNSSGGQGAGKPVPPLSTAGPVGGVSTAQRLPTEALARVFAFVGYTPLRSSGRPRQADPWQQYAQQQQQQEAPHPYPNPALLLCRRWNKAGCAWFNEHVSLRGWQRVKWLLAQQGPVKLVWDAAMAVAALRERNVLVAGPLEDPKVALALLGHHDRSKKSRAAASLASGPLRLTLPPGCQDQPLAFVGAQAAGLLQLGASVEEALATQHLLDPFRLIEMALVPALAEMQLTGMPVDLAWFPCVVLAVQERLLLLQELADAFGGCQLNLNCQDAVHHLLYVALRVPAPPTWTKKTNVFTNMGGKSKTVLGPVQTEWLRGMVDASPAVKVVLEWRQLAVALRNLQKLRQCTRLQPLLGSHRVRCRVDACGSATGRIILTQPAMQLVAHEVVLRRTWRATIQDELEGKSVALGGGEGRGAGQVPGVPPIPPELYTDDVAGTLAPARSMVDGRAQARPTRRPGLPVVAVRADSYLWANAEDYDRGEEGNSAHYTTSQFGTLRCILSSRLNQPFPQNQELGGGRPGFGLPPPPPAASKLTLADYWRARGLHYSDEDAARIRQVVIEFPPGVVLTYPADKAFRHPEQIQNPEAVAREAFDDVHNPAEVLCPRNAFPAAHGFQLLSADYSQIELHILAHFSKDPKLCAALQSREDVFQSLAATWKRVPVAAVTPAMRAEAKQLAYAILYGQSVTATAQLFAVSTAEAGRMQSSFLDTYPGIRALVQSCKAFCKAHGYVETLLGRRRYLPDIRSNDAGERAQAERQSVNTVCQGSAADLIKLSMVNIHHELANLPQGEGGVGQLRDCRLVLQIHDELLYEVKEALVPQVTRIVTRCMEGALQLMVPLRVNVKVGPSWGQLQEVVRVEGGGGEGGRGGGGN